MDSQKAAYASTPSVKERPDIMDSIQMTHSDDEEVKEEKVFPDFAYDGLEEEFEQF